MTFKDLVLACALLLIMAYSLDLLVWAIRITIDYYRIWRIGRLVKPRVDAWNRAHPHLPPLVYGRDDLPQSVLEHVDEVWHGRVEPERKQPPGA